MKRLAIATLSISLLALSACEELENLCGISADDLGFTEEYNTHLNAAIYIYQVSDLALRDSTLEATGMAIAASEKLITDGPFTCSQA